VEIAALFRALDGAEWAAAFDSSPMASTSLQAHVSSKKDNSIFSESNLCEAYSATCGENLATGALETQYSNLTRSLLDNPFEGRPPTNVEVSSVILSWGQDVYSSAIKTYRQEVQISGCHRPNSGPLSKDSVFSIASVFHDVLFGSAAASSILATAGSSSNDASSCEFDNDGINHSEDGHELDQGFDTSDVVELDSIRLDLVSGVTGGDSAGSEGSSNATPSHTGNHMGHPPLALWNGGDASLPYVEYLMKCQKSALCLHVLSGGDGSDGLQAKFALPPYDQSKSTLTHGPPELVEYTRLAGSVNVRCICPAARMARRAQSSENVDDISGLKDRDCWHKACLKHDALVDMLISDKDVAKCDPVTGVPSDFVRIVGAKHAATTGPRPNPGPSRLYVAVHSNQGLGGPGNMRTGLLTLALAEGTLHISCDACGSLSKAQTGAAKKSVCRHFDLVQTRVKHPTSESESRLQKFLSDAALLPEHHHEPLYDVKSNCWAFPSLDKDNREKREELTGIYLAPPSFPFGSPDSKTLNSMQPTCMGGPGDPNALRLHVLLDIAKGVAADQALLSRQIVTQRCSCDSTGTIWTSIQSNCGETLQCSICGEQFSSDFSYSTCNACHLICCGSCRNQEPVVDGRLFTLVFPEIAHLTELSSAPFDVFVAAASKIALTPTDRILHLKPPLPPRSVELSVLAALEGKTCAYSEEGYTQSRRSQVFGFSYSQEAIVYSLECTERHPKCSLPFLGQYNGMHCQSTEYVYRVELFENFWFLLRHSKGMGAATYVKFVQYVYDRNGAGNFVSEPSFRAAIFGYFSTLKIDFNVPCMTCPINKCSETGVLFSACKNIQIDAVSLRCLAQRGGDEQPLFDEPTGTSQTIDCKKEHIYDRLFIKGSRTNSQTGKLRVQTQALCKVFLEVPAALSLPGNIEKFGTLAEQFMSLESVAYVAPSIRLIVESLGRDPDLLTRNLANMLLRMCNDHAGEILQIINEAEIRFLEDVLQRSKQRTLSVMYLQLRRASGIRASLVELVSSALVCVEATAFNHTAGVVITPAIVELLSGMLRIAEFEFARAGNDRSVLEATLIPSELRRENDPSKSGIAVNFTKGGAQLRHPPRFTNEPSDKDKKLGKEKCRKPQHLFTRHQKFLFKTKGLFNVICLESGQPMAQMIMRASEGRSLGDMLFFLFLPRFPRTVSSDIGCQGSSWAHCRLRFYFRRWRWLVDLFHISPHKCKLITDPREFAFMRELNDSLVEQLHSAQRALGMTMQSTSSERAMFLVQLINYDIYCKLAYDAKISRSWPEDAPVYSDDDNSMEIPVGAAAAPPLNGGVMDSDSEESGGSETESEGESGDGDESLSQDVSNLEDFNKS